MVNDIQTVVPIHTATILKEIYEWEYHIREEHGTHLYAEIVKLGLFESDFFSQYCYNSIIRVPKLRETISVYHGDIHAYPLSEGDLLQLSSKEQFKIKSVAISVNGKYTYTIVQDEIEELSESVSILDDLKILQRELIQSKLENLNWWGKLFNGYDIDDWREREYD